MGPLLQPLNRCETCINLGHPVKCVEWKAGGFPITQTASEMNISCQWVDPRRSKIARLVNDHGFTEYDGGEVHFIRGAAKDYIEAQSFYNMLVGLHAQQGLLATPNLVKLTNQNNSLTPNTGRWIQP